MEPIEFPDRWLQPVGGSLSPSPVPPAECAPGFSSWDIEVDLAPFDVSEALVYANNQPPIARTSFRFDFICLPIRNARELSHRSFRFPVNPEPGYVDGSIYLMGAHNPADLDLLVFGELRGGTIDARFVVAVDFEFEQSGLRNRRFEFTANIDLPDQLLR